LFQLAKSATLSLIIADDLTTVVSQTTDISAWGQSVWDTFIWDTDVWSTEAQQQYEVKGDQGVFGYSWYFLFSQTGDDINMKITQFDVLTTLETGRGI
jgi:hypothetical protein